MKINTKNQTKPKRSSQKRENKAEFGLVDYFFEFFTIVRDINDMRRKYHNFEKRKK